MKIEGESGPRFRAYMLDRDDHPHECVFERDDLAQLDDFSPRTDRRYAWKVDGRWMSASEFEEWKASKR